MDWDCWRGCGFCAENPLRGSRHLLSACCLDGSVYIVRQPHLEVGAGLRAEPCPPKAGLQPRASRWPVRRCTFGQSLLWGRSAPPCQGTRAPEEGDGEPRRQPLGPLGPGTGLKSCGGQGGSATVADKRGACERGRRPRQGFISRNLDWKQKQQFV